MIVETRRAGAKAQEAVRWTCEGEADFQVETIEKQERGTSITLVLKDDEQEFANNWRLRSIIKKYSDHIAIPVQMEKISHRLKRVKRLRLKRQSGKRSMMQKHCGLNLEVKLATMSTMSSTVISPMILPSH